MLSVIVVMCLNVDTCAFVAVLHVEGVWMKIQTQTSQLILGEFTIVELSTLSFHL